MFQALCRAEDEEDIVAASQAKAEQVAELAEFNENIPLDDGGEQEEVEELSKAEQEIAALVEQVSDERRYIKITHDAQSKDALLSSAHSHRTLRHELPGSLFRRRLQRGAEAG